MIKDIVKNLSISSTLRINEISKELESEGKEIFKFGFGQSPFEVPENVVYAGNPAREIKKLDKEDFITRKSLFTDSSTYLEDLLKIEKKTLEANSLLGWIESIFWPKK